MSLRKDRINRVSSSRNRTLVYTYRPSITILRQFAVKYGVLVRRSSKIGPTSTANKLIEPAPSSRIYLCPEHKRREEQKEEEEEAVKRSAVARARRKEPHNSRKPSHREFPSWIISSTGGSRGCNRIKVVRASRQSQKSITFVWVVSLDRRRGGIQS